MATKKSPADLGIEPGSEKTLYLVDVSSFIFRAYYAIRHLSTPEGEPVNAVYGVASMLNRLLTDAEPHHLVVVYDSKEPSFRHEVYEQYKANRSAPPEDLVPQFARIEELVEAMGFPSERLSGVEADDLIATYVKRWSACSKEHKTVVVTGDKDLMQLVDGNVKIWDTMKQKVYDAEAVEEKFGVPPTKIRDYLALVGDSSDNVPGVPSIGPKTAVTLLKEYGDLEGVIAAAEAGKIKGKKSQVISENAGQARLSARLVTLKDDCDIHFREADCSFEFRITPKLEELFKRLDFNTLLERWTQALAAGDAGSGSKPSETDARFETVDTEAGLKEVLAAARNAGEFAVDLETTSLNPRAARLCGVALAVDRDTGYYVPLGHKNAAKQLSEETVLKHLKPLLEDPKVGKIGQNLKYDWSVLYQYGVEPRGITADTMIAAYVVDPEGRHNFDLLCRKYLAYEPMSYEEICGKGKNQIGFDEVEVETATRYAAEDALYTLRLWDALKPRLEKDGVMSIFTDLDLPLVPILAHMECEGVCLDLDWLERLSGEFERDIGKIEERIQSFAKEPVNLNSPRQLATLLFEELGLPPQSKTKGRTGYSTDAKVLDTLAPLHEVPRLLLEYREISKLKGTYVDPLPGMIDGKTGKVHASFHQTVAATGRLSSSEPNLQNIPVRTERGMKIRRAFVPSKGNLLLSADYSQIELRILAHMSGDPALKRSFQNDEDVHRRTASEIFDVSPQEVDDRQRGIAKAINFGLMYGKTAYGLAQELKIARGEAKDIIDRYFHRYSGVKMFLDGQIDLAKENGYVTTILGRRRKLAGINASNPMARNMAERMAMNTPIQGTAADLMKLAMIHLDEALKKGKFRSRMIIQVHDEILLDCPQDEIEDARRLVVRTMENAMKLSVPLKANSETGENWAEL